MDEIVLLSSETNSVKVVANDIASIKRIDQDINKLVINFFNHHELVNNKKIISYFKWFNDFLKIPLDKIVVQLDSKYMSNYTEKSVTFSYSEKYFNLNVLDYFLMQGNEDIVYFLKKNNIKALILDVDNTLIDYDRNMPDGTVEWVEQLKNNGIKFYIVSNTNKKDKVEQVSQKLKIKYNYFAKKPLKTGLLKAQKELQEKPENVAVVGDQIFTDVIGANRTKMFSILVKPINEKDIWVTKIKRPIENRIIQKYLKQKEQRRN